MVKKIVQIGDPVLEKKAEIVSDIHDLQVQKDIQNVWDTVISVQDRSAGLSAPQIGISKSICVCRRVDLEEREGEGMRKSKRKSKPIPQEKLWEIMINPEIVQHSEKESTYWEGCLSIGETEKDTLYGPVSRPDTLRVRYLNREGESKEIVSEGFFSHVIQHEIDHLNGILFLSRVKNPLKNIWKVKDIDKYVDKHGDYPPVE